MLRRTRPFGDFKLAGTSMPLIQWVSVASLIFGLHILIWRELFVRLPTPPPKIMSRIEVELRAIDLPGRPPLTIEQPPKKMTSPPRLIERRPVTTSPSSRPITDFQPQTIPAPAPRANTPLVAASTPAPVESASTVPTPSAAENEAVTAPRNAAYLHNPKPIYPLAARRAGYEGTVIVRALIQTDGSAERVEVKKSSGYELLDRAALEAVKKWRFIPAKRGSEPIIEWVDIPWIFKLEEE